MIRIHLSRILGDYRMTQRELAQKTGIRPATIHAMYHEKITEISLRNIDKICEVLDCDLEDIIEYIPDDEHNKD